MKEFILKHKTKIIDKSDKQVLEVYQWGVNWYLASGKSLWDINQFEPNNFELYNGSVEVGQKDLEWKEGM